MGCNCKNKKKKELVLGQYVMSDLEASVSLINNTIHITEEDKSNLYKLHNQIYFRNKQFNMNCGTCFNVVKKNLLQEYERQEEKAKG